jgi:hypothetical protein
MRFIRNPPSDSVAAAILDKMISSISYLSFARLLVRKVRGENGRYEGTKQKTFYSGSKSRLRQ